MSETTDIATPFDYAELMRQAAAAAVKAERSPSDFISFRAGQLTIDEQIIPGNKINCVILESAHENDYFPRQFDPKRIVSPDCWAINLVEDDLAPDPNLVTKAEHTSCADCPRNQWPEKKGSPKECKNIRRLALIDAAALDKDLVTASVWYARLPVTSVANWSKYVVQLGSVLGRPPWGVVTELSLTPDPKSQFKVNFRFVGLVPDGAMEGVLKLSQAQEAAILFPYPKNDDGEEFEDQTKSKPTKGVKF